MEHTRTRAHTSRMPIVMLDSRFFRSFLDPVEAAGGRFVHIRTGNARPQQQAAPAGLGGHWDGPRPRHLPLPVPSAYGTSASAGVILTAECPVVAYRQGAADLCATYGLASAMHEYGDTSGAAAIAACARAMAAVVPEARTGGREGRSRPRKRSRERAAAMRHGQAAGVRLRGWATHRQLGRVWRKPWATQAQRGKVRKRFLWGASRKFSGAVVG